MPTKLELFNQLKIDLNKGEGGDLVHMVDHAKEKQRKRTNPVKSTRVLLNCRTPEQWTEFQMAKERYFDLISDPHVALDLMIRALKTPTVDELKAWLASGHQQAGDAGPAPSKAEIPDWAK